MIRRWPVISPSPLPHSFNTRAAAVRHPSPPISAFISPPGSSLSPYFTSNLVDPFPSLSGHRFMGRLGGGQFAASISPEISLQICPFVFNPSLSTSSTDLFTAQHNADSHFNAIGNEGEMKGIYLYGRMDG